MKIHREPRLTADTLATMDEAVYPDIIRFCLQHGIQADTVRSLEWVPGVGIIFEVYRLNDEGKPYWDRDLDDVAHDIEFREDTVPLPEWWAP